MNNKINRIIALILLVILFLMIGSGLIAGLYALLEYDPNDVLSGEASVGVLKWTLALGHFCTIFLPALIFIRIYRKEWFSFGLIKSKLSSIEGSIVIKSMGLIFLGLMASSIFVLLLGEIDLPEWASNMDENNLEILQSVLSMDGWGSFLANIFIIAVLPAIGEELLFRAIIQNEILTWFKNHHTAIILTSFFFAAFHLEVTGLMPKFAIGLVLGYVYYWSGNIVYPIILHFINNGFQVLLLFIIGGNMDMPAETVSTNSDYIIGVCAIPLIYLLAKSIRSDFYERSST